MILQVHDELNFSVPIDEKERVEEIVIEEMEKSIPYARSLKSGLRMGKELARSTLKPIMHLAPPQCIPAKFQKD